MAKRITLQNFRGIKYDSNDFHFNLRPTRDGSALVNDTYIAQRKQKGATGLTNMSQLLSMVTARFKRFAGTASDKNYLFGIDAGNYIYYGNSDETPLLSSFTEFATPASELTNFVANSKANIVQNVSGIITFPITRSDGASEIGAIVPMKITSVPSSNIARDTFYANYPLQKESSVTTWYVYNVTDGSKGLLTGASCDATHLQVECSGGLSGGSDNTFQVGDCLLVVLRHTGVPSADFSYSLASRSRFLFNFEGSTYILADEYIEALSSSFVLTNDFLRLEPGYFGECASVNGNRVLIGANNNYTGKLFLWNGYAKDYTYKIEIQTNIQAIASYGAGWIVVAGRCLYYTDGYSLQILDLFPDIDDNDEFLTIPSGIMVKDDTVYISGGASSDGGTKTTDTQRNKTGIWQYFVKLNSWAYYPYAQATGYSLHGGSAGCIYFDSNRNTIYTSYGVTTISNPYFISTIEDGISSAKSLLVVTHNFKKEVNVLRCILEIEGTHRLGSGFASTMDLRVGMSRLDDLTWRYTNTDGTTSAANTVEVEGSSALRSSIGKAVLVLEGQNGGNLDFIQSISNHQQANETWTLENNQNGTFENSPITVNMMAYYKSENKTLNYTVDTTNNFVTTWEVPMFENIPHQVKFGRAFGFLAWFNPTTFPFKIVAVHIDYEETAR